MKIMKIWQKIKNFIIRMKIKKIEAPKDLEIKPVVEDKIKNIEKKLYIQPIEQAELNDMQKLEEILKVIGCSKTSIQKILKIENIDIQNFRKNLYELSCLDYSNLELTIIITQNMNLITMNNEILKEKIKKLDNYFTNKDIVKDLIYSNSNILNENIEEILESTEDVFEDYGISIAQDPNIIIENSNILFIAKNKLINSLTIIREYAKTQENFIRMILTDPIIIGIQDASLLEDYVE